MGLGFTASSGGDFLPVIKYDARAGRMFRVDRDSSGGTPDQVDITNGFTAVFDFENIEVGHIRFMAGMAPDFQLVALGQPFPAPRSAEHKQGFRILVKLPSALGGDVRELASTAGVMRGAMEALHGLYEAGKAANPGLLPVVEMTSTSPVVSGKGERKSTNYAPVFAIKSWVPRPADLTAQPRGDAPAPAAAAPAASAPAATPPATGAARVAPPTARTPDPAAMSDFG